MARVLQFALVASFRLRKACSEDAALGVAIQDLRLLVRARPIAFAIAARLLSELVEESQLRPLTRLMLPPAATRKRRRKR